MGGEGALRGARSARVEAPPQRIVWGGADVNDALDRHLLLSVIDADNGIASAWAHSVALRRREGGTRGCSRDSRHGTTSCALKRSPQDEAVRRELVLGNHISSFRLVCRNCLRHNTRGEIRNIQD